MLAEEGFGGFEEIEEFAQRAAHDGGDVEVHVVLHFARGMRFPFFQDGVVSRRNFFAVVVHVLDEEDLVVESFFVLWITCTGADRLGLSLHDAPCCGVFCGNEFQTFEHSLVDLLIGIINQQPNGWVEKVSKWWKHVFNSEGKIRKSFYKRNDAFAFL